MNYLEDGSLTAIRDEADISELVVDDDCPVEDFDLPDPLDDDLEFGAEDGEDAEANEGPNELEVIAEQTALDAETYLVEAEDALTFWADDQGD